MTDRRIDIAPILCCERILHLLEGALIGDYPVEALENGIDNYHESVGADFLRTHFPDSVSEPVRLHVAAKRYLCATDADYFARLSAASVNSLNVQGGPMDAAEVTAFEANPHHREAVRLRLYDDDGKVAGLDIKPVTEYRETLASLVNTRT